MLRQAAEAGGDEAIDVVASARTSRSVTERVPEKRNEDVLAVFLRMAWLDSARIRRSKLEGMNEGDREGADQYAERAELS